MNKTVEMTLRAAQAQARVDLDNAQVEFNRTLAAHQMASSVLDQAKVRLEDLSRALAPPQGSVQK